MITDSAVHFQEKGVTAMAFDPRTIGESDGIPRNDTNPHKQIEDFHDALTYMKSLPMVDPQRIGVWGYSLSAVVALAAAAMDKRVKFVIAMCPATVFEFPNARQLLKKAIQDRESQMKGNKPLYIPTFSRTGLTPTGTTQAWNAHDIMKLEKMLEDGRVNGVNPSATIQTYYRVPFWEPLSIIKYLEGTPSLVLTPENDSISPAARQKDWLFANLPEPKEHHIEPNCGHMDILSGAPFPVIMARQMQFIETHVGLE